MLTGSARRFNGLSLSKAGFKAGCCGGLTSLLLLTAAGSVHDATALNETRTLSFHHTHSDEDLTVTFKRDGRYDEEALKKINHFLRDWRSQDETVMDRHLFDIIWEVYRDVDGKAPIQIISAYRSPATNAMLRRRSAHSGVARYSQHMLGHAMDFYIPGVPLEQIRYAGLRLQRGGVGFYPTSGSPFVHLDTGSIRHWPRMTHDQLAKVFPDGRTVHVPTDGVPLKGYELARADIERRGNGDDAATISKPGSFLASLFKGKANDDEDEAASAPAAGEKPAPTSVAAAAPAKTADPVPVPRAKPQLGGTLQLASADAQLVQPPKPQPKAAAAPVAAAAEPQTPADIINARGFWDNPPAPQQATPAQIWARKAREALAASDPQPTASVSSSPMQALAYAPAATSAVERGNVVAASAPIPRGARPARNADTASTEINTVAAKGPQGGGIALATRLSAGKADDLWMRIVMLAPSASSAMSVTMLGDADMTQMRAFFVKPQAAITMGFADDPMMGMSCDRFSGSATATLATTSFVVRTAALR
ncbi:DUF882 domain-containing protein [Bradyrhizobium sp. NP1]|uniref:DUF882 domain-containing protein n=1 Tax=Bradyrhizobium sp. NP1 TaxID=3049772 RepID=UPI0025A4ED42|nr:DUF882 domain-containing protein [Bradyrhizobium sp. NP1]WJR77540.1 DUF882 domain-containing protein [Bradyrhizobium sp. NP1]